MAFTTQRSEITQDLIDKFKLKLVNEHEFKYSEIYEFPIETYKLLITNVNTNNVTLTNNSLRIIIIVFLQNKEKIVITFYNSKENLLKIDEQVFYNMIENIKTENMNKVNKVKNNE